MPKRLKAFSIHLGKAAKHLWWPLTLWALAQLVDSIAALIGSLR